MDPGMIAMSLLFNSDGSRPNPMLRDCVGYWPHGGGGFRPRHDLHGHRSVSASMTNQANGFFGALYRK